MTGKTHTSILPLSEKKGMSLPQKKLLAICVGAVFAQCGITTEARAQSSFGNSAAGADTVMGNSYNPPGRSNIFVATEEDGYDTVRRTPSGQSYGVPIDRSDLLANKTESGWLYSGSVEIGLLGGRPNANYSKYLEYRDPKKGLGINWFDVQLEKPDSAFYFNAYGGGVDQNDQFYDLQFGRYNDWRVRTFYTEIPHVYSTTFKQRYVLNGNVLQRTDLGVNTTATGAGTAPLGEVDLVRKRMGVRGDWTAIDSWKFFATATTEKRKGERPFALHADSGIEGFEPIDQRTSDFSLGGSYVQGKTAFNLRAGVSIFQNDKSTIQVSNNGLAATGAVAALAIDNYSLPPDNRNLFVKGDGRYEFDFWNTRLTGGFSWNKSTQDDRINPVVDPGNAVATAAWLGANGCGMIRCNSDLRIDTTLYNLGLSTEPVDALTLRAGARYLKNDNKSDPWITYNPYTQRWWQQDNAALTGALPNNAIAALNNNLSRIGRAREDKTVNYTLSAEYLIDNKQSLDLAFERENIDMTDRERDSTHENKWKLTYTGRNLLDNVTLRGSVENARKRGSAYDVNAGGMGLAGALDAIEYARNYGYTGNPGLLGYSIANLDFMLRNGLLTLNTAANGLYNATIFNIMNFQKLDIADRDRFVFNGRVNYSPREDIDLGLSAQIANIKYPKSDQASVTKERQNSINFDANWQPSAETQFGAWVSRQTSKTQARENNYANNDPRIATNQMANCGNPAAVTAVTSYAMLACLLQNYAIPGLTTAADTDTATNALGLTLSHDLGWARLGVSYTYTRSKTAIKHNYPAGALTAAQQTLFNAQGDYPSMMTRMDTLEINLAKDFTKNLTGRLMYRMDKFSNRDWHYDYLSGAPDGTFNGQGNLLSDMGPQNFIVQTFGAFLQYKF